MALKALYNVNLYKSWHKEISQGQLKMPISSENSCIMYQIHKKESKWYHERDYLYLRHVFQYEENYYIADRWIENTNFIPIMGIERGRIVYQVIKIIPASNAEEEKSSSSQGFNKGCRVMFETHMEHGGLLNWSHSKELTLKYLKGFESLEEFFTKKEFQAKLVHQFHHHWSIDQSLAGDRDYNNMMQNSMSLRTEDF